MIPILHQVMRNSIFVQTMGSTSPKVGKKGNEVENLFVWNRRFEIECFRSVVARKNKNTGLK